MTDQNKIKYLLFGISLAFIFLGNVYVTHISYADGYTPLAPIGNFVTGVVDTGNLNNYLNKMFQLGIAIAAGLAVVMIIVGGIEYMSSDAIGKKSDGKKRITAAIVGLIVALGSYMLLNTLSPDLLKTDLGLRALGITPISVGDIDYPYTPENNPNQYGLNYYGNPGRNCDSGVVHYDGSSPRLDTDGGDVYANIDPSSHSNETSYAGLDASRDPYVVVDNTSQLGQRFLITDQTTGRTIVAIGGDIGHGFGEISAAAAQGLGIWTPSQGDNLPTDHRITITPYQITDSSGNPCGTGGAGSGW